MKQALAQTLIQTARAMQPAGLNKGTAGNVSVRDGDGFLITGQTTRHFLAEVVDGLVPALQDIGVVRGSYRPGMLRDNLSEF